MRDSREKGAGMRAGSETPFPDLSFAEGIQSSLRSKRFRLISKRRKTKEWRRTDGFGRAKNGTLSASYFERSLTLVPCSLLRNRTETLAMQVTSSQDQSQTESQKHVAQHKKGGKPPSLNLKNAYDRNH